MYCKHCGHRSNEKAETCPKCGVQLKTEAAYEPAQRPKVRWRVFAATLLIAIIVFGILPKVFFRPELETIGPTDKLRLLRALERSEYRRIGQQKVRLEQQKLVVIWDLRWNTLPEAKQRDIVRIVGRAWNVVGGQETRFQVEGEDGDVARYIDGMVYLGSDS